MSHPNAAYCLSLSKDLVARHFLVGGDWGSENFPHSHDYRVEVRVEGSTLDDHGFLVDLVALQRHVDRILGRIREHTLNELPEFAGLNPSLENFARIVCLELDRYLSDTRLHSLLVQIWEDETAWASFRHVRP